MNIVVLIKQVPDTWAQRSLSEADKTLARDAVDAVINELDEYAIEEALRLQEAHGGEVTLLTMGPPRATEMLRKALAMGADKAIHVVDDALHGSDAVQTSAVLAAALGTLAWDIAITGAESTDARMSVMAAMLAEQLGVAQLSAARSVTVDGDQVTIERQTEEGFDTLRARTPVVMSVVEKINEPRYPSFKGIMAAKSKPITTISVAELGLDPTAVGLAHAATSVVDFTQRPARSVGQIIKDDGDGGTKLAEFLASQKFI